VQRGRSPVSMKDLLDAGLLTAGQELRGRGSVRAKVTATGGLVVAGTEHRSPSNAATAALDGTSTNGWFFWRVQHGQDWVRLDELRRQVKR
jgi:hypothetical protein